MCFVTAAEMNQMHRNIFSSQQTYTLIDSYGIVSNFASNIKQVKANCLNSIIPEIIRKLTVF